MSDENSTIEKLNISVAMFLLYGTNDEKINEIWEKKWKYSKTWEFDLINEIKRIPESVLNEKYENFMELFNDDSSISFDLKKNRFTDYGLKGDEIRLVKSEFSQLEDLRINKFNEDSGRAIKNNSSVNSLIYPSDLAFISIKVSDFDVSYSLSENKAFTSKMFDILDALKQIDAVKNLKEFVLTKNKIGINEQKIEKSFLEHYNENKDITKNEYLERYKKSYFLNKNGIESVRSVYESNVILTKDGTAIIPMSDISNSSSFNPDSIKAYQNIVKGFDGSYAKLFTSGAMGKFISFNGEVCKEKQPEKIFIGEGVATCLSIKKMLKDESLVVCAFNADNLIKVVSEINNIYDGKVEIIVCADKDKVDLKYDNKFLPSDIKAGKGYRILESIVDINKNNNLKFTYAEFKDGVDKSSVELKLDSSFKKLLYKCNLDRSDFNDNDINVEKTLLNLKNPKNIDFDEIKKIPVSIIVSKKDNSEKIIISDIKNIVNVSKQEYLIDLSENLLNNSDLLLKFNEKYGDSGINSLLAKLDNKYVDKLLIEQLSSKITDKNMEVEIGV